MTTLIVKSLKAKFMQYFGAFLVLLILNFLLPRMLPGDPIDAIYGDSVVVITPEIRAHLVEQHHLNDPLRAQFFHYLYSCITLDFGYSYSYNAPVREIIEGALPWTLLLAGTSLFLAVLIALFLGIESGWRRGGLMDRFLFSFFAVLNGIPGYFVGMLLIIFLALKFQLFPIGGAKTPYAGYEGLGYLLDVGKHLVLPMLALSVTELSWIYLLMRGSMLGVINEPFIVTGRLKGLKERVIKYRYAARNALLPVVTRLGIQVGQIVTGVLLIEIVFSYPGVGLIMYNALMSRDLPLLQGLLFVLTICILGCNFTVDLLYPKIDPRVNYA
ncbi:MULTISPECIES: ABC transporter permease [unclassified Methanosarcina]|uniref:ABC transporter permease n=1 Tax=unclassified Methanosarcina TaxID=2644672 RepID=UPI000615E77E|nr:MULTISPECIES: ABC transporter permease [unclassified Methanosarcina]AKB20117.1 Oligopeptide transport system permease protein OppB [Methanosarcina sp. WWM596]AKB21685.1 Oligopeptide transport system permease protein OppB [Methanosarcina sp. WH1]